MTLKGGGPPLLIATLLYSAGKWVALVYSARYSHLEVGVAAMSFLSIYGNQQGSGWSWLLKVN